MIHFVVTPGHAYTLRAVAPRIRPPPGFRTTVWTYPRLFAAKRLPPGVWAMCDLERLSVWELGLAAEAARLVRDAGPHFRLLNDPACAASRYEMLLRLHDAGLNRFRAWRAEDGLPPARFPVFLRVESHHDLPVSGLLRDRAELAQALDGLAARGVPRRGLLAIEYEAEPLVPGVFRKYAAYRIGERIVADHTAHDDTWLVKNGNPTVATAARHAEELTYVRENPHAETLMRAFEIARIEYGRADYGVVGGAVQVWEINTNPTLPFGDERKAPPSRAEATALARENRLAAFRALDIASKGAPLRLDSDLLARHRAKQRWWRHPIRD